MPESGECGKITRAAETETVDQPSVCRVLRPTLFAPDIAEAIVDGRRLEDLTLPTLMKPFRVAWVEQRADSQAWIN